MVTGASAVVRLIPQYGSRVTPECFQNASLIHWRHTGGTLEAHWRITGGSLVALWKHRGATKRRPGAKLRCKAGRLCESLGVVGLPFDLYQCR